MELTFEDAVREIPAGLYRHYKGNEYRVICIARHSETLEPVVVYLSGTVWEPRYLGSPCTYVE